MTKQQRHEAVEDVNGVHATVVAGSGPAAEDPGQDRLAGAQIPSLHGTFTAVDNGRNLADHHAADVCQMHL